MSILVDQDIELNQDFFRGSKFDLAGRVYKGVPAPTNLEVPPHSFDGDMLKIGEAG